MKQARWVAGVYLLFGLGWIYLSDHLAFDRWAHDPVMLKRIELGKGYAFVVLSAAVIWLLVQLFFRRLVRAQEQEDVLFSNPQIGMLRLDARSRIAYLSPQVAAKLGYEPGELRGLSVGALTHPDDLAADAAVMRRLQEGASDDFRLEKRLLHRSGHALWFELTGKVHRRSDQIGYYVASLLDISARKVAEAGQLEAIQALETRNTFLRTLTEHASDGILACDAQGEIVFFNQTLRTWLAVSPEAPLPPPWPLRGHLRHHELRLEVPLAGLPLYRAHQGETLHNVEYLMAIAGQPERFVEANGGPLYDGQGQLAGAVILIRDITRRREREFHLAQAILQATEQERAYIARELHDGLTQHLSVASMNLKNLAYDCLGLRDQPRYGKARQFLDEAINQSRTMAHQLMPKAITDFGLAPAVEELIEDTRDLYDFAIDFSCPESPSLTATQVLHVYRIVQEALGNVQRHAHAQRVTIALTLDDGQAHLSIADDGQGFEAEAATHPGGIGLQTMQHRAADMEGTLIIESQRGAGTRILLSFPVHVQSSSHA